MTRRSCKTNACCVRFPMIFIHFILGWLLRRQSPSCLSLLAHSSVCQLFFYTLMPTAYAPHRTGAFFVFPLFPLLALRTPSTQRPRLTSIYSRGGGFLYVMSFFTFSQKKHRVLSFIVVFIAADCRLTTTIINRLNSLSTRAVCIVVSGILNLVNSQLHLNLFRLIVV